MTGSAEEAGIGQTKSSSSNGSGSSRSGSLIWLTSDSRRTHKECRESQWTTDRDEADGPRQAKKTDCN